MKIVDEWVTFESAGAPVRAFGARPDVGTDPLPALVVIMEVWGVDGHIQDLCRRFAAAGYLAVAPDLYSHGMLPAGASRQTADASRRLIPPAGPAALDQGRISAVKAFLETVPPAVWQNPAQRDAAVDDLPESQRAPLRETMGLLFNPNRPWDQYVGDLRATVARLQENPRCRGMRIGATGYCMGGALSARLACAEPALAAAVIYYGAAPPADQIPAIGCPVLGLYGGDDLRITEGVPAFAEAMRAAGKSFDYHVYPGAPHAFFNDERRSYRLAASRDAWARTLAFFRQHLGAA